MKYFGSNLRLLGLIVIKMKGCSRKVSNATCWAPEFSTTNEQTATFIGMSRTVRVAMFSVIPLDGRVKGVLVEGGEYPFPFMKMEYVCDGVDK